MLLREISTKWFKKNPDYFNLDGFQTFYADNRWQSLDHLFEMETLNQFGIWGIFEKGNLIGVVIGNRWYNELFYIGFKKKRALLELYYQWNELNFKFKFELSPAQASQLKAIAHNHIDEKKLDEQNRVLAKYTKLKAKVRTSFNAYRLFDCTNPNEIFSGFNRWESDELREAIPTIVATYNEAQLERFALMGKEWRLKIENSRLFYVEDSKEAIESVKQEWLDKGYSTEVPRNDPSHLELFTVDGRQNKEGKVKLCLKYHTFLTLDHKYNDHTIPYYRHVLKRHIVDYYMKINTVLSVQLLAFDDTVLWSHIFNRQQKDYGDLIYKHSKAYLMKQALFIDYETQLRDLIMSYRPTDSLISEREWEHEFEQFLLRGLKYIAYHTSIEQAILVFEREFKSLLIQYGEVTRREFGLTQELPSNVCTSFLKVDVPIRMTDTQRHKASQIIQEIHDKALPYYNFVSLKIPPYCTPSVLKKVLVESSPQQVLSFSRLVWEIVEMKAIKKPELRSLIYRLSKKGSLIKNLLDYRNELKQKQADKLVKEERQEIKASVKIMNVSSPKVVENFLTRMRRYDSTIRFNRVKEVLTLPVLSQMIKGEYDCVFQAQDFTPSYQAFGQYLKELLKGNILTNPKKLYHQLRQIKPVQSLIEGDLTAEEGQQVLEVLTAFKQTDKTWETLLKLTAKLEEKGSPEFLIAGNASVCCMSFGNGNATTYAKEKAFSVLNLYLGDRVVGNTVLWMNEVGVKRFLVLDNIEIHPNYKERLQPLLKDFLMEIIHSLMTTYACDFVLQGNAYNDFELFNSNTLGGQFGEFNPIGLSKEKSQSFYTDARFFKVVAGENQLLHELNLEEVVNPHLYLTKTELLLKDSQPNQTFEGHYMPLEVGGLPF